MPAGPRETIWEAEPHTLAKHRVFRKYLDAWVPTLGQSLSGRVRVVIIDGFAGPGEYKGGEDGSPVVAIKAVVEHQAFSRLKGEFVFLFVEANKERCDHLRSVALPRLGELPENVKIRVECGKFDETAMAVLDDVEGRGSQLAPSFAFIDPFGFSDTPMAVIRRLLNQPRAEVLITVMLENVNRFLTHPSPSVLDRFDELFGNSTWRELIDVPKRFSSLGDFYKKQLLSNGAKYVWSFRMIDEGNRPIYDLFFATKNIDGLKKMKRAMWAVDPGGGFRFSDRAPIEANLVLFGTDPDFGTLRRRLVDEFLGETKLYSEIEEWVLTETPFHDGHIKTRSLKILEDEGRIEYLPPIGAPERRRKKGTFPEFNCRIRFL